MLRQHEAAVVASEIAAFGHEAALRIPVRAQITVLADLIRACRSAVTAPVSTTADASAESEHSDQQQHNQHYNQQYAHALLQFAAEHAQHKGLHVAVAAESAASGPDALDTEFLVLSEDVLLLLKHAPSTQPAKQSVKGSKSLSQNRAGASLHKLGTEVSLLNATTLSYT